jgi:hypothetical protein
MAKRSRRRTKTKAKGRKKPLKRAATRRSTKRTAKPRKAARATKRRRTAVRARPAPRTRQAAAKKKRAPAAVSIVPGKTPRLNRERRQLEDVVQTPPSSLDMDRHASAVRSGRHELSESLREHTGMTPALTGGDIDADWENAYFSGDEAPGGDNPTPDQDVVEEIGHALGVDYQDAEELKGADKITERDKHRWEFDPASSEDYKDRK